MSATAQLLSGLIPEVVVAPGDDGSGYVVALILGDQHDGPKEAEQAADDLHALSEALEEDLAGPLRVPAERLELPP